PDPAGVFAPSPAEGPLPLSGRPQALQNFLPAGFSAPHSGQVTTAASDAPQPPQKSAPAGFSSPQDWQTITRKKTTLMRAKPARGASYNFPLFLYALGVRHVRQLSQILETETFTSPLIRFMAIDLIMPGPLLGTPS
ncbi:MAG: hypothetical protein ABI142_13945, partial [Bryocella sp.]